MDPLSIGLTLATRFAPGLIRRFRGEGAGDVADSVLGIVQAVTGVTDPEEAMRRLEADVELQHDFRMQAARLEIQLEEAYLADVQNARSRDLAFLEAGKRNWRADALSVIVSVGIVANGWFLMTQSVPPDSVVLLSTLQGALIAGFMNIMSFEFGSSRGSKEKTAMMGASISS